MLKKPIQHKNWKLGYSPGFGEPVQDIQNGPSYSGAPEIHRTPPDLTKTSFYTQTDVLILATWLKEQCIDQQYNAIYLTARSCGAGTAINCLYKLLYYDNYPNYFQGSAIKSKEDADAIITAINNGALEFTVPFLGLGKANALIIPSLIGGYGVTFFILFFVWYKMQIKFSTGLAYSCLAAVYYVGKNLAMGVSVPTSEHYIVPATTHYNYDPSHITPLDALAHLPGKIKCPVLIHFSKYDGVLQNQESDIVAMYNAFRTGNEENTYILYANDDWHNELGDQYSALRTAFTYMVLYNGPKINGYKSTIEELRRNIRSWNFKFKKQS
jgi:hypothetical protein